MDHLAKLVEDQPMKSLDRVVWWIEYVLRHKGARHLKAPQIPWYLYFMLDFIGAALISACLIIYIAYKAYRAIYDCAKTLYSCKISKRKTKLQ